MKLIQFQCDHDRDDDVGQRSIACKCRFQATAVHIIVVRRNKESGNVHRHSAEVQGQLSGSPQPVPEAVLLTVQTGSGRTQQRQ